MTGVQTCALPIYSNTEFSNDKKSENIISNKIHNNIISLAPSLTEILYILNADSQIAGVTEFCIYPEAAKNKPKIGGYMNINYEQLIKLKPDLILAMQVHSENFKKFERLNIRYETFSDKTVRDIRTSIEKISKLVGKEKECYEFLKIFDAEFSAKIKTENKLKPKVLVIVGREFGRLKNAVCAGRKSFYNDLINFAGGINAAPESGMEYNSLNSESIISMNPDIIIEIYAPHSGMIAYKNEELLRKDWNIFKNVNAVKKGRVHYIINDYATLPGPRIYLLYKDIKKIMGYNIMTKTRDSDKRPISRNVISQINS